MTPQEYIEKLEKLEKEVASLRQRVIDVEAQKMTEFQPVVPYHTYQPMWTIPTVNTCQVCGLKFDGPMGYACSNPKCSTGITC